MRLGLRAANQYFSKAIKAVKAGQEVILTNRGKPVAVIKPLPQDDSEHAVIRRLEAEGLLRPALKRGPMPEPRWKPICISGRPLSETIEEERDERCRLAVSMRAVTSVFPADEPTCIKKAVKWTQSLKRQRVSVAITVARAFTGPAAWITRAVALGRLS